MRRSTKISLLIILLAGFFAVSYSYFVSQEPAIFQLSDVTGHLPDLQFAMISDTDQPVTEASYRGFVILLFFGFTSCPDECPTTMTKLASIIKGSGKDADHIRVLFVSVDPVNDTPKVLQNYLKNFDGIHMTGLFSTGDNVRDLAKRYRAAYQAPDKARDKEPVHSDAIYIFDQQGHARLLATPSDGDEQIKHDLHLLVETVPAS